MKNEICKYCEKDGYYTPNKRLIDKAFESKNIITDLMLNIKKKTLTLCVEYNMILHVAEKKINYCPMCGRKIG